MNIQKIINICLGNWIVPVAALGPILFLFIILGLSNSSVANTSGIIILCCGLFWLLISAIYQFTLRNWQKGIETIGLSLGGTLLAFIIYSFLSTSINVLDGDHWADSLIIPDDIEINLPKDFSYIKSGDDEMQNEIKTISDFQLYNSSQPGIYKYDFWKGKIESGTIYLKAFEITQEYPLSPVGVQKNSSMKIHNPSDSILRFSLTSDFKIYEGDWGKPYAARFEVWFTPANGEIDRKLFQKNYKIEGWQH